MIIPQGILPALVTPFKDDESLDENALRQLVRRAVESGVHGLFCLGTNGEFFSLTTAEKLRITEIVVEEANGRVPVYAGAGGIGTNETKALIRDMAALGVDAVSVITPYFLSFTQQELRDHYLRLADSTALPIVLYNIPARTGNALAAKTVAELSKVPNIVGIKDSSGSFDNILQYIAVTEHDDRFSVLAGTDSLILPTLMSGGKGAISATANVFPKQVAAIYENWKKGDFVAAEKAQGVLRELRNRFGLGTLPSVLKEAMNMIGLPAGCSRLPVAPLTAQARAELAMTMQAYRDQGLV
ncbi:4-hydroxy-tetrahydrodipicolinate synthase [Paenibacillus ginsengihumi]|uniref:4-hydroxy-tetrahydrodipicolinate synthase n=1 Tax=Paenibacillus ginsengihumi TaxID=431596 RepID=UPI0004762A6A|nr:4-hydroxy-tetrahydrodipicolinate synthase [Paenibacillus ginsengihumi]